MTKRYLVVYEKCPHNFAGHAPDVPGCFSTGRSLKNMREMMTEALEFHLSSMLCDVKKSQNRSQRMLTSRSMRKTKSWSTVSLIGSMSEL
jgi:predicted RNase H-like HicB family nuclease